MSGPRGGYYARMHVISMIESDAPPRPACFDSDRQWRDWLIQAHRSGLQVTRRVDRGKSRGHRQTRHELLPTEQIPYCSGCTDSYRREMERQGRCYPSAARCQEEEEEV